MAVLRLRVVFVALLSLALDSSPAFGALPQRTFVASYGVDTNPCSLALPCRSFDVAVPAVTPGGEVIVLDSAGYGPTTITQSVSIITPAGVYAGISVISPANLVGVTINAPGIKVVLQNLAINGLGGTTGISVLQAAQVDINNCALSSFTQAGISATAANVKLNVRDTLIRDTGGDGGIVLIGPMQAVLERVQMVGNTAGLLMAAGANASVARSVVAGNGSGISMHTATATIEDSLIADNFVVVRVSSGGQVATLSAARNMISRGLFSGVVVGTTPGGAGSAIANLSDNLISQYADTGVTAQGGGAVATVNNNTFAGNANAALLGTAGGVIHTVKGADGLPNNGGVQTTPTIGAVLPSNPF